MVLCYKQECYLQRSETLKKRRYSNERREGLHAHPVVRSFIDCLTNHNNDLLSHCQHVAPDHDSSGVPAHRKLTVTSRDVSDAIKIAERIIRVQGNVFIKDLLRKKKRTEGRMSLLSVHSAFCTRTSRVQVSVPAGNDGGWKDF